MISLTGLIPDQNEPKNLPMLRFRGTSVIRRRLRTVSVAIAHSTYDTLYLAFAVAMDASAVVMADGPFVRSIRTHPDPTLSAMVLPLDTWARSQRALPAE